MNSPSGNKEDISKVPLEILENQIKKSRNIFQKKRNIIVVKRMFINGAHFEVRRNIRNMVIAGDGVWIDGVKQEAASSSTSSNGKVVNLYFGSFENCQINRLEVKQCNLPEALKFNNCNIKGVKSGSGDLDVTGGIAGDVSTTSGDISCEGSILGNASTVNGDVNSGEIKGKASTVNGRINKKRNSRKHKGGSVVTGDFVLGRNNVTRNFGSVAANFGVTTIHNADGSTTTYLPSSSTTTVSGRK